MMKIRTALLPVAAALLAAPSVMAAEAGSVLFTRGDVTAERQPPVAIAKGDSVLEEDAIVTGAVSRAQLLMLDGAKIAIRPESRLVIEEYVHVDPAAASVTTRDEKSVVNLVKGGFRTITGAIGSDDAADYEVRTPVGTLGIRGTDYAAVFCRADCAWAPGVAPGAPVEDGLYISVVDGEIEFRTATDTLIVSAGEFAFIPLAAGVPQILETPPPVLLDDNELLREAAQANIQRLQQSDPVPASAALTARRDAPAPPSAEPVGTQDQPRGEPDSDPGGSDTPAIAQVVIDPDGNPIDITPGVPPQVAGPRSVAYSSAPLQGTILPAPLNVFDNDPGQYRLDGNFNLVGFDSLEQGRTGPRTVSFDIGTSSNVEAGFDAVTVLRWGRWSGGSAIVSTGADPEQADLANQSIHWIQSPDTAPPVMPITGTATYSLVGATSPTDNLGNVGVLGDASFQADFTQQSVTSNLSLQINGSNWDATGLGVIGAQAQLPDHLFSGNYSVTIDGQGVGGGAFTGFFSDSDPTSGPATPDGVGLSYSLQDGQQFTVVSGTAAFGNP